MDAAAVYWNPALLAEIRHFEVQGSLAAVLAQIGYERERRAQYQRADGFRFRLPLDSADLDPTKTGWAPGVSDLRFAPSGSLFAAIPLHPDWTLGLGLSPAQAALVRMPHHGAQRWAVQDATILAIQAGVGVGWRPLPWLSFGAGVHAVGGFLELRSVFDLATSPLLAGAMANPPINQPNDFGPNAATGVRELDVLSRPTMVRRAKAFGWNFNAGLAIRPASDWLISLAYQHATQLTYEGEFWLDLDHPFFTTDLAAKGLAYPPRVRGTAFVELPVPASVRLGLAWQITEALTAQLHANWVWYRQIRELRVTAQSADLVLPELGLGDVTTLRLPRRWNDTLEVEIAVLWRLSDDWRLGARAGYHSPASPDATIDLTSIDGHRLLGTLMADYEIHPALTLTAQIGLQGLLPRSVVASEFDRGNGRYELLLAHLGGALTWRP